MEEREIVRQRSSSAADDALTFMEAERVKKLLLDNEGEEIQLWHYTDDRRDYFVGYWSRSYQENVFLDEKPSDVEFVVRDKQSNRDVVVRIDRVVRIETTHEIYKPHPPSSSGASLCELDDEMQNLFY